MSHLLLQGWKLTDRERALLEFSAERKAALHLVAARLSSALGVHESKVCYVCMLFKCCHQPLRFKFISYCIIVSSDATCSIDE